MDREDIMGTPSPELKQLWIRVLKRIHPDLAIDEQDRIRCERLTKLANEAYQAGDVEALRAVLRPTTPNRFFKPWFRLSFKPLLPVAIAVAILLWRGFSFYAETKTPAAQVDNVEVPIQAHVEVPDAGIWQLASSTPSTTVDTTVGSSREGAPAQVSLFATTGPSVEPSHLYMKQMRERLYQSFSNYERVDANVPSGNWAEMWFDVNRDGSLTNVRVGKPSGWNSLDYACMRAVQRTEVGALPENYKLRTLPATFTCIYTGSNALQTSSKSDLYVGSVRNTTTE
jgi:TonB family protein